MVLNLCDYWVNFNKFENSLSIIADSSFVTLYKRVLKLIGWKFIFLSWLKFCKNKILFYSYFWYFMFLFPVKSSSTVYMLFY